MTEFKKSDLLKDDALEAVAGGMKQCPGPIMGPKDSYNPIPFIPLGPFRGL